MLAYQLLGTGLGAYVDVLERSALVRLAEKHCDLFNAHRAEMLHAVITSYSLVESREVLEFRAWGALCRPSSDGLGAYSLSDGMRVLHR